MRNFMCDWNVFCTFSKAAAATAAGCWIWDAEYSMTTAEKQRENREI